MLIFVKQRNSWSILPQQTDVDCDIVSTNDVPCTRRVYTPGLRSLTLERGMLSRFECRGMVKEPGHFRRGVESEGRRIIRDLGQEIRLYTRSYSETTPTRDPTTISFFDPDFEGLRLFGGLSRGTSSPSTFPFIALELNAASNSSSER